MQAAVDIRALSHSFGDVQALKELTFGVPKGTFFIVIGPNGSGKTTLLKLIAGVEPSQSGAIDLLGRPLTEYSRKELARKVALVPQLVQEDVPFTVREVVLMGRSPHMGILGMEQENDLNIAQQAMRFTGIERLAGRRMDQLSGGERQRVFIARAICQEPQIILLDEPTASLDLAHQVRIMDLMEQLKNDRGITVVMISHDINLAAMYADRLLLLKDGALLSEGSPETVLTYQTLETAYGCTLLVDNNPLGDFPRITLVPEKYTTAE